MIRVRHLTGDEYEVKVSETAATIHRVTLRDTDRQRLAPKNVSPEKLIEESFRFLLEHERNTSILGSFDLPMIGRYFPEYQQEIRVRLQRS